jgi:hypothetical protein
MVFPQAEFEIVPDSQAASPSGEGSISAHSANPKNPNVANVLRMLSLETVDDSDTELESETLPINTAGNNEDNWGLDDTNSDHASDIRVYNDDDYDYILQESQDPTITPSHSAVYGVDTRPQVQSAISAISARSLSTTISTTVTVSTSDPTLPPPPAVEAPESSSGPLASNKPIATRTLKRRALAMSSDCKSG